MGKLTNIILGTMVLFGMGASSNNVLASLPIATNQTNIEENHLQDETIPQDVEWRLKACDNPVIEAHLNSMGGDYCVPAILDPRWPTSISVLPHSSFTVYMKEPNMPWEFSIEGPGITAKEPVEIETMLQDMKGMKDITILKITFQTNGNMPREDETTIIKFFPKDRKNIESNIIKLTEKAENLKEELKTRSKKDITEELETIKGPTYMNDNDKRTQEDEEIQKEDIKSIQVNKKLQESREIDQETQEEDSKSIHEKKRLQELERIKESLNKTEACRKNFMEELNKGFTLEVRTNNFDW